MVLFPKLYCNLFGHRFKVTKDITYHVKEYKCSCCNKEMTTNSNGMLTILTPKLKDINTVLEYIHKKKKIRRIHPSNRKVPA